MSESAIQAFCDRKFGMFIHWGLYAVPGGRFNGKTMETIGEWFQSYFRMPNAEYAKFASQFNPTKFDADAWIRKAAEAGMKYIVFTSKHHDGFCMYDTKVSDFNIVKMTPWGRDPLRELSQACLRHGVKLGIYYSHHLDWHEPDGGDPGSDWPRNVGGMSWGNDWDFPDYSKKDFGRYFYGKVIPQVTELLTNYGEVCELWCDCPLNIKAEYSQALRAKVKELQPDCMINARIGNDCQDFQGLGDNQLLQAKSKLPIESPGTLNRTWGFKFDDHDWKSPETIIEQLVSLTEKNANYLLNVGPMPTGELTPETNHILSEVGAWMRGKEPAIHASSPNPFPQELDFAYCTRHGHKLYFFLKKPLPEIQLSNIQGKIINSNAEFHQDGETVDLKLPDFKGAFLPLVSLEFEDVPQIRQELVPQNGTLILGGALARIVVAGDHHATGVEIDEAAVVHEKTDHAKVFRDGSICDWHNPSDSLEWNIAFPEAGKYRFSVVTQTTWRNQEWSTERSLSLNWNGRELFVPSLVPTADLSTPHCKKRLSLIGELEITEGERGILVLRSPEIRSTEAGKINLNSLVVERVTE